MADNTFTVRGATIIDGSGSAGVKNDLVVIEGRIAEVGKVIKGNERGKIVDDTDLTLSPGFIDMHAHSDLAVISDFTVAAAITSSLFEVGLTLSLLV
jgi:N-acyl-D-amino-acid deacylase